LSTTYSQFLPITSNAWASGAFGGFVFHEFNLQQKIRAIKECYQRHEKDPETLKAIEHLMEHFNWCFTTRNLVLHAHRSAYEIEFELTEAEPNEAKLSLAKPKKGSLTQLNFMYLSLEHLRAIADSMHEGYLYLLNLWAYMALFEGADVSRSTIQSELAGLVINRNAMLRAFRKSTEHHRSEHW
jgi:hypothetical protein